MTSRPTWQGHLRLSLVACPVALFPATTAANDVRFNLINPATGNRIRTQTIDPDTGEVERRDLVRGFEFEKGRYVLLTEAEIRSVRLESTRTIDIERFVDASMIDRIWWNDPYYLVPDGKAGIDAFGVIRAAMEAAQKIALARIVLGTRERFVAIEPRGQGLLCTTLRSHDEVREDAALFEAIPDTKIDAGMRDIAARIIGQKAGSFDPSAFEDRYEDALRALIRAKQGGDDGGTPAPPPRTDNVIDLMEALRRSLETGGAPEKAAAAAARPAARAKPKPGGKAPTKAPAVSAGKPAAKAPTAPAAKAKPGPAAKLTPMKRGAAPAKRRAAR